MKIADRASVYAAPASPSLIRPEAPRLLDASGAPMGPAPTGAWQGLATRSTARTSIIDVRAGALDQLQERSAQLELLVGAYYPSHPKLHLFTTGLDLRTVGEVGRLDETGRLEKIVLGLPHALDGDWRSSPLTRKEGSKVDLHAALIQHAALTRFLLSRGVEVFLVAHPDAA
jgi:hypothetical protein